MSIINISLGWADAGGVGVACGERRASGVDSAFCGSAADFLQPITHSAINIIESCDNARIITRYESGFRTSFEGN
jgi:hypothetical protein